MKPLINNKLLGSCLLLLVFLQPAWSSIVAREKVIELIHQAQAEERLFELKELFEGDKEEVPTEFAQPLSLQIVVMHVTDALNREMNIRNWQAMLRALGGDREILKRFAEMRPYFASLEKRLNQGQDGGIEEQLNELAALNTSMTTWTRIWPQLQTLIHTVGNLHDLFDCFQRNATVVNRRTLSDYADTVHSTDGLTIGQALISIHKAVCPFSMDDAYDDYTESENNSTDICRGGVLETLQTDITRANDSFICSLPKSTHQLVYDLYALLTLTDAKGYAMMQFSWMILRLYGRGNNSNETEKARVDFEKRMTEKAEAAQKVLSQLSTWMWKCDPPTNDQIENETYIRFKELLQGYVVNELDLNQDNTCKDQIENHHQ
ncbi:uncharacterized protein LOC124192954 [Daphnia pulex]|uniref:uncharacterized protein LOC124192954 n=1 Tax=Daphnia pulex TaxID=6669 RepID=UPI001EDE7479|nr:uncharacterized protein LOC124192954 [Daphnia pulex]